jgi:hypothetical protein
MALLADLPPASQIIWLEGGMLGSVVSGFLKSGFLASKRGFREPVRACGW